MKRFVVSLSPSRGGSRSIFGGGCLLIVGSQGMSSSFSSFEPWQPRGEGMMDPTRTQGLTEDENDGLESYTNIYR